MTTRITFAALLLAVGLLGACQSAPTGSSALTTSTATLAPNSCHARTEQGQTLPDPQCTPGALNPAVTQATIRSTICKRGWTATVRPPVSYTERLKRQGIIAYGYSDRRLGDYEEDHLVSLELGGSPTDPHNLWPEPGASPNVKDRVESAARSAVCSGRLPLVTVQAGFESDWVMLGRQLGMTIP